MQTRDQQFTQAKSILTRVQGLNQPETTKPFTPREALSGGFSVDALKERNTKSDVLRFADQLQATRDQQRSATRDGQRQFLRSLAPSQRESDLGIASDRERALQSNIRGLNDNSLAVSDQLQTDTNFLETDASSRGRTLDNVGLRQQRAINTAGDLINQNTRSVASQTAELSELESQRLQELEQVRNNRLQQSEALKFALGFQAEEFAADIQTLEQINALEGQAKEEAREDLQTILNASGGLTLEELNPDTQSRIIELLQDSPLDINMVRRSLLNQKNEQAQEQELFDLQVRAQEQSILASQDSIRSSRFRDGLAQGQFNLQVAQFNLQQEQARAAQVAQAREQAQNEQELALVAAAEAEGIQVKRNQITSLLEDEALSGVIGPNKLARAKLPDFTGERAQFERKMDQFTASLTLENAKLLTGAKSDKDVELLTQAGTALGRNPKTGKFDYSEEFFREQMTIIDNEMARLQTNGFVQTVPFDDAQEIINLAQ